MVYCSSAEPGWSGGSDRERGFWGCAPAPADVLEFIESTLVSSAVR
jgi:hypothetical protein